MKKLISLIFLLISFFVMAESKMKKEIIDNFADKIKDVTIIDNFAEISFMKHAAFYKLRKDHPRYKEFLALLELRKKDQKLVQITSIIPMMEIKELKD